MSNYTLEDAQREWDNQLPEEDTICLRCEENEAEPGEDYCEYCNDVIRASNRDKFIEKETY